MRNPIAIVRRFVERALDADALHERIEGAEHDCERTRELNVQVMKERDAELAKTKRLLERVWELEGKEAEREALEKELGAMIDALKSANESHKATLAELKSARASATELEERWSAELGQANRYCEEAKNAARQAEEFKEQFGEALVACERLRESVKAADQRELDCIALNEELNAKLAEVTKTRDEAVAELLDAQDMIRGQRLDIDAYERERLVYDEALSMGDVLSTTRELNQEILPEFDWEDPPPEPDLVPLSEHPWTTWAILHDQRIRSLGATRELTESCRMGSEEVGRVRFERVAVDGQEPRWKRETCGTCSHYSGKPFCAKKVCAAWPSTEACDGWEPKP